MIVATKYYSKRGKGVTSTWDDVVERYNHIKKYAPRTNTSASYRIPDAINAVKNPKEANRKATSTYYASQRVTNSKKKKK